MNKMADAELTRRESQGSVSINSPSELLERLNNEEQRRRDAETLAAEREGQLRHLRQQLSGEETELQYREQQQEDKGSVSINSPSELLERLNNEEQRRRDAETLAAEREGQLRHLRQQLSGEETELQYREQQQEDKVREMRRQKSEALMQVAAKEAQVAELQRQVADKLSQRQAAQKQLADKEHLVKDLKEQPSDRLFKQQAAQTQAIEIQREVCNLQQQLAVELSKRQAVQYQIIDKDRVICELQASLAEYLTGVSSPYHRHRVLQAESERDGSLIVPPHPDTIVELSPVQGARSMSSDGYGSLSIPTGVGHPWQEQRPPVHVCHHGSLARPWPLEQHPQCAPGIVTGIVTAAASAGAVGALPAVQVLQTGSGGVPPYKGCEAAPRTMMRSSTWSWGGGSAASSLGLPSGSSATWADVQSRDCSGNPASYQSHATVSILAACSNWIPQL
ncbi:unnamed protein product [Polarella glacialis]|uniref:Uncharacterized protein n=1 Tax=Polarella glacialis TaxID=89957 RepID=A0A813EK68_POLGL|nr:unnamed protein product [Polarella glacialis]